MKTYGCRYKNRKGEMVISSVSSYKAIKELIKGEASNSIIETRLCNDMPITWHNEISKHNEKIKSK